MIRLRAMSYLKLFGPDTYGLEIPRDVAKYLEGCGYVEWVPPKFGTTLYGITEKGREAAKGDMIDLEKPPDS